MGDKLCAELYKYDKLAHEASFCQILTLLVCFDEGGFLGTGFGQELLILGAVGVEWTMGKCRLDGLPFAEELLGALTEEHLAKALPDILYCLCAGVQHVFAIETVVAQFVHHDFKGGKVNGVLGVG